MNNAIAKKIVRLLTDPDFLDNHNMKEKAWWVRRIYDQETEKLLKKRGKNEKVSI